MAKRPAEQWYTGDYYRAVDVQKCCAATRGIWRDALDAMANEQIFGKIRGTRKELCRLLRCSVREFNRFVSDNRTHRFADVTERNEKVTVVCRRMYRQYIEREQTKKRVSKYRKGKKQKRNGKVTPPSSSNAEVTPYSSSSTSSSNNTNNSVITKSVTFTLAEVLAAASVIGVADDKAEQFYHHYNAQGWLLGNGQPIMDLHSALVRWRNSQYKFDGKAREQDKTISEQVAEYEKGERQRCRESSAKNSSSRK